VHQFLLKLFVPARPLRSANAAQRFYKKVANDPVRVLARRRSPSGITMDANDLDRQLKQLELEKQTEELRQLRANSRIRWITPTALAALLPLLAGFGLWIANEVKLYSEGYRALAERDSLRAERTTLQQQKDSLNIEVNTLLQLKAHYAQEAERLRNETVVKQDTIDQNYMRAVFTSAEAMYALDLIKGVERPTEAAITKLRTDAKPLPAPSRKVLDDVLQRQQLTAELMQISRELMAEFNGTLKLMPVTEWTQGFQPTLTGQLGANRKIMVKQQRSEPPLYYDIQLGRQLTAAEVEALRR
jgi:hypothetical protein